MQPLPQGGLPADQTIEGGAQVRVTPAGFAKLTQILPAVINDLFDDGFCIPRNKVVDAGIAEATICGSNHGSCTQGCHVSFDVDYVNVSVPNNNVLRVSTQFSVSTRVRVDYEVFWVISGSCNADVWMNNARVAVDIRFSIDPQTGELKIHADHIHQLDLTGIGMSGCGGLADIVGAALNLVASLLNSTIGNFVINLLLPVLDDLIQGLLPDPLGIAGVVDLTEVMAGLSPGTRSSMEMRMVPGGYVQLVGNGMSLGIITGLNHDHDISTRGPGLTSEPALCVPPVAAPDFSLPPASLSKTARNTFTLAPADEFLGAPDPAADLAIGISETTLDLGGHHAFTSGALCLGVGTSLIPQLNLGIIGILVPSLAELGNDDGTDPLLLVTRPQKPIDFSIGDGTPASPSLNIHIRNFEVDFYAFLFERFVRGFTLELSMDVGVNLEFTTDADGNPAILPTLVGIDSDAITLVVHNAEFLRESPQQLEAVLPAIFDLALPLIADGLDAITLPDFAGFTLTNLQVRKVVTSQDDFLALFATLGPSAMMAALSEQFPSLKPIVEAQFALAEDAPKRAGGRAQLAAVHTPTPEVLRAGLLGADGGALPEVVIDVDATDALGQPLEWAWNINGGMWRPFSDAQPLVIRDRGLAVQGRYTIELLSRVKGDYRTTDLEPLRVPVVIDSVGPRIHTHKAHLDGKDLVVPAFDLVTPVEGLEYAFGKPGDERPWTDFGPANRLPIDEAVQIAGAARLIQVWARDEMGNESSAPVDLGPIVGFHGSPGDGGCDCSAGPADGATLGGLAALAVLVFFGMLGSGRTRRTFARLAASPRARRLMAIAPWVIFAAGISMAPACSCGSPLQGDACELDEDCADRCPANTVPICFDNTCLCADDVPHGRIGQYSSLDITANGTAWISAYNSTHGDLMVASFPGAGRVPNDRWQFVDGVPAGPVVVEGSDVRDGIFAAGPDVGKYTDIVVHDNAIMVSYHDVDNGSLKFAANYAGQGWQMHTVDTGNPGGDPELGWSVVGQYSSITARGDDGRPGIAYFAQVSEGGGNVRTEVRFASAQTATPQGSQDWSVWVVDSAAVPAPGASNDPFPIPEGLGLFIDSTRLSDHSPVIVYYDRQRGELKLARFDAVAGTFLAPETLDGGSGHDVGWYPSVLADSSDELHVSYVSATYDDLLYINTIDRLPSVVDDGFRIVGTTEDGLPKPEFHFVGDDSSVILTTVGPVIVYQNATTHELLFARKNTSGFWEWESVAGNEVPFAGAYGFYADAAYDGQQVVMSTWVIDQPANTVWVEVFRRTIVIE